MGWVTPDAPSAAELDACVTCGLCLPHCPTFRLTGDEAASPRGRLAAMAAIAGGVAEVDETFEAILDACLQCRACETACPSLVPFGRAMEGARIEITAQRPTLARRLRHLAVGRLVANRWLMRLATTLVALLQRIGIQRLRWGPLRPLAGMRRLPLPTETAIGIRRFPEASPRARAAVLAGCVMDPWFQGVHQATIGLLVSAGYAVEVPGEQTCCGALAAHDGDGRDTKRLAQRNSAAFADFDLVVADAAGCSAHLKEYDNWVEGGAGLSSRVRDVTEVVADELAAGRLPVLRPGKGAVAVQDPCHLRHAQRIVDQPRAVLIAAGYTPVDVDPGGMCCGAAGVYSLLYPETSNELGRRKAAEVAETGTSLVASANPGCEMQLRRHLGSAVRVAHPVELYWEALEQEP